VRSTPLRGTPLLCYSERDTIPRKIILVTSYYKNMENYGGLSDCEELVGGYSQEMMWLVLGFIH